MYCGQDNRGDIHTPCQEQGGVSASGTGLTGIGSNYQAYQKWVRTTRERFQYLQVTLDIVCMSCGGEVDTEHHDLRPVARSEECVMHALAAVESLTNPFDISEHDRLVMLSSRATFPSNFEKDILRAEAAGKRQKEAFVSERLEAKEHFFDPIKKPKTEAENNGRHS
jgi:hypothetical protein